MPHGQSNALALVHLRKALSVPSDLTIFAAKYLVFIEAALALIILAWILWQRPRLTILRWVIAAGIMLVLSFVFSRIGAAAYTDPRPFTVDHVKPLISHAADNGFPSDHALLAAAIVAAVGMAGLWYAIPFIVLAVLVDWARVGTGVHHVSDVIGSSVFVAIATLIALAAAPALTRLVAPRLPAGLLADTSAAGATPVRRRA